MQFRVALDHKGCYSVDTTCAVCRAAQRVEIFRASTEEEKERVRAQKRNGAGAKRYQKYRACTILGNSRQADRKRGLINDLDKNAVEQIIARPCAYCGRQNVLRGLDRIDNAGPHTKINVMPACGLCNLLRADFPYDVWLELLPLLKPRILRGEFDSLRGGRCSVENAKDPDYTEALRNLPLAA